MIKLEMLGIELPSIPFVKYHDDGFVNSINDYTDKLNEIYGRQRKHYNFDSIGRHLIRRKRKTVHYHIFYEDIGPVSNAHVREHEETHFLDSIHKLETLEKKILKEANIRIKFRKIEDKEIIAFIGGIYAVLKSGHTIEMLQEIYNIPLLKEAERILKKCKIK